MYSTVKRFFTIYRYLSNGYKVNVRDWVRHAV
jgi:hypothetical protein